MPATLLYRFGRITSALFAAAVMVALLPVPAALAADSAVLIMYHRFGEGEHPSTNITLEQFEAHLDELASGGYTVLPLPEIMSAIREGRDLPDRAIGITIDDAYLSVHTEAWPRLRDRGFPFTLFVATDPVDKGFGGIMSWDQIRELQADGVTIGNHTVTHLHMADHAPDIGRAEIERANARFVAELGEAPAYFAYPFGETNADIRQIVADMGLHAAFGQHSGVVHGMADPYYLPRFPLNEQFGDADRFRLVANTLPLPVSDVTPTNPTLTDNPPSFGFTLDDSIGNPGGVACFASNGETKLERQGQRIEVRFAGPFAAGHARINCTLAADEGRWRWFGMQYYVPK